jgi:hypothetical protein
MDTLDLDIGMRVNGEHRSDARLMPAGKRKSPHKPVDQPRSALIAGV